MFFMFFICKLMFLTSMVKNIAIFISSQSRKHPKQYASINEGKNRVDNRQSEATGESRSRRLDLETASRVETYFRNVSVSSRSLSRLGQKV